MEKEAINLTALWKYLGKAKKGLATGWHEYSGMLNLGRKGIFSRNPASRMRGLRNIGTAIKYNPYKTTAIGAGVLGAGAIGHNIRSNRKRREHY